MSTDRNPHLGVALAWVKLLTEHPELPHPSWSIDSKFPTLRGHLHDGTFEDLDAYAEVLGGSIRPGRDYELEGQMVRPHYLTAVWRDVKVEIAVVLPAPVEVAA